jgi:methyl-accepting chemotaxis protein
VSIHSLERLVHEISTASASQSQGVTQVNESIKYMDNFTQENASLVEEVASAAESTGQQAADLLEVVKFFKVQRSSVLSHTI